MTNDNDVLPDEIQKDIEETTERITNEFLMGRTLAVCAFIVAGLIVNLMDQTDAFNAELKKIAEHAEDEPLDIQEMIAEMVDEILDSTTTEPEEPAEGSALQ